MSNYEQIKNCWACGCHATHVEVSRTDYSASGICFSCCRIWNFQHEDFEHPLWTMDEYFIWKIMNE